MTKQSIFKFIADQKVAFIGSVDSEGYPNQKAMLPPRKIEGNKLYFTTNTSSMRVKQYRDNPKACVYFYSKGMVKYQGVMLVGTMEVSEEQTVKNEIWKTGDSFFYKKGVTDPDYCVLVFTAKKCRYYSDLKTENVEI